jgi:glucose-6-phosphate 1-epimerase
MRELQDISTTTVTGLAGVSYIDKVLNATTHTQADNSLAIKGEVDRAYTSIPQSTTSVLVGGKPRFDVERDNLSDTVVWNPWIEKAAGMGDYKPKDGYKNMLCVEVGAVNGWQKLDEGDSWEGGQIIKSLL